MMLRVRTEDSQAVRRRVSRLQKKKKVLLAYSFTQRPTMKLAILALALLVASCYAIEIPPFGINLPPFSSGGSISTPSSSINFDPNAVRCCLNSA
jgi:hypothetical protein